MALFRLGPPLFASLVLATQAFSQSTGTKAAAVGRVAGCYRIASVDRTGAYAARHPIPTRFHLRAVPVRLPTGVPPEAQAQYWPHGLFEATVWLEGSAGREVQAPSFAVFPAWEPGPGDSVRVTIYTDGYSGIALQLRAVAGRLLGAVAYWEDGRQLDAATGQLVPFPEALVEADGEPCSGV